MIYVRVCQLLLSALLVMPAVPAVGQDMPGTSVTSQLSMINAAEPVSLLEHFDLRRWPDDAFFEARISRIEALSEAHGVERGAVLLDLAELYLSQMLTQEAQEFVDAVAKTDWRETARFAAVRDAVHLLRGQPVEADTPSPLLAEGRPDRGLWASLNAIAKADLAGLEADLNQAVPALIHQSGPVARFVLPLILETAIALNNTALSEVGIGLMQTLPELAQSPRGQYLLGKHEENLRNNRSALEAYFEAARGWDRYAALSRVAIADLALKDGGAGALLAASDVLSAGAGAWRDDPIELTVLERQARVNGRLGDNLAALLAYRRMLARFPNAPESRHSKKSIDTHLTAVYQDGKNGDIDLSQWIQVHQILLPTFRFLPGFSSYNEMLADKLFDMGSTVLAIAEFRHTLTMIEENEVLTGEITDADDLRRVRFKLALALERAGKWEAALNELELISEPLSAEMRDKINKLRVRALAELGDNNRILRTYVANPDGKTLRTWGKALFVQQDWTGARQQYKRLLDEFPDAFRIDDASYLLIAAYREGDVETARMVAKSFPELSTSEGLAGLASSLLEDPVPLLPLRQGSATDRLENFERAIGLMKRSGL